MTTIVTADGTPVVPKKRGRPKKIRPEETAVAAGPGEGEAAELAPMEHSETDSAESTAPGADTSADGAETSTESVAAAPKAKREKKEKAPKKERKVRAKKEGETLPGGQGGAPIELVKSKLNDKELRVSAVLYNSLSPTPLNALSAESFPTESAKQANSWVRNSLRRLARGRWIDKVGPGTYRLSDHGRTRYDAVTEEPAPSPV